MPFPVHPDTMKSSTADWQLWLKTCEGHRFVSSFGEKRRKGPHMHRLFVNPATFVLCCCHGDRGPAVGMLGTNQGSGLMARSIWKYMKQSQTTFRCKEPSPWNHSVLSESLLISRWEASYMLQGHKVHTYFKQNNIRIFTTYIPSIWFR